MRRAEQSVRLIDTHTASQQSVEKGKPTAVSQDENEVCRQQGLPYPAIPLMTGSIRRQFDTGLTQTKVYRYTVEEP